MASMLEVSFLLEVSARDLVRSFIESGLPANCCVLIAFLDSSTFKVAVRLVTSIFCISSRLSSSIRLVSPYKPTG